MKQNNFYQHFSRFLVGMLVLTLLATSIMAQGRGHGRRMGGGNGDGVCLDSLPKAELSDFEKSSLAFMREEEKLAHDVYLALYEQWKSPIFRNIARSEMQHTTQIGRLLNRYELADPYQETVGVFTNEDLQKLYTDLVAAGKVSLVEADKVGATIEDLDISDLQKALNEIDNLDIRTVYQNLMKGSRNHLRSFYAQLKALGVEYTAQYIDAAELEKIVTTSHERGRVDADGNPVGQMGRGRGNGRNGRPGYGAGNGDCPRNPDADSLNNRNRNGKGSGLRASNFPNPANPSTQIVYEISDAAPVRLSIYNIQGQLIRAYDMGYQSAGNHQQAWDARDTAGTAVTSGIYFYHIQAGDHSLTQRFSLIK